HSQSAMSSSGKATASSSCLSSECFDLLTRSCVKCSDLFKDNTRGALQQERRSGDLAVSSCSSSIFPPCVPRDGTLSLRPAWPHFVSPVTPFSCPLPANMDAASPLPSLGCQDPAVPEGDAGLALAPCLHLNGGLNMVGPPRKAGAKRRPCCQGDADGDIILLSAVYPQHEECNHSFPLPATELGATALVTTKTTQNCVGEER
ncbi:hypothetical protein N323_03467, partial [Cathartes aura]